MHDGVGPETCCKYLQLLLNIVPVLSGEAWKHRVTLGILHVTALAGRDFLGFDTLLKDLLPSGGFGWPGRFALRRWLGGEGGRDICDRAVGELRGHSPHERLRVRVSPGAVTEGFQLHLQVCGLLRGKIRESRRDA